MGQLEKYGLYVLCLLIFLIIGVSIWGDPASAATLEQKAPPAVVETKRTAAVETLDLSKLQPAGPETPKAVEPAKVEPKPEPKADGKVEPKAAPTPVETKAALYTVKPGDTYAAIARAKLGDANLAAMITEANPKVDPKRLRPGMELTLPTQAAIDAKKTAKPVVVVPVAPEAPKPESAKPDSKVADAKAKPAEAKKAPTVDPATGPRTYKIAQGDTFQGLSKRLLGSDKRVDEIKEMNPSIDPTRLRVGQVIRLPAK